MQRRKSERPDLPRTKSSDSAPTSAAGSGGPTLKPTAIDFNPASKSGAPATQAAPKPKIFEIRSSSSASSSAPAQPPARPQSAGVPQQIPASEHAGGRGRGASGEPEGVRGASGRGELRRDLSAVRPGVGAGAVSLRLLQEAAVAAGQAAGPSPWRWVGVEAGAEAGAGAVAGAGRR